MTIHSSVSPALDGIPDAGPVKLDNPVHASLARIAEEFAGPSDAQLSSGETSLVTDINDIVRPQTPAEACLAPTLALFGWAGEGRRIREALPHFDRVESIEALRLAYRRTAFRWHAAGIRRKLCILEKDSPDKPAWFCSHRLESRWQGRAYRGRKVLAVF